MRVPTVFSLTALALAACATSTTFTSTWKATNAGVLNPEGRRVAAVFVTNDESSRREAEDTLVKRLNDAGAQGVASYTLIPGGEVKNIDSVKERLASAGVDGAVMMRVIGTKERVSYTRGPAFSPYYRHFWGYWGYGWDAAYEPTRVSTDEVVSVETLVYSLRRDELIWAGTSRTVNPSKVKDFVNELADAATKQMRKDGLLGSAS